MNKGMWKRNLRRGAALALTLVMSLSIAARGAAQERLAAQAAGNAGVMTHEAVPYSRRPWLTVNRPGLLKAGMRKCGGSTMPLWMSMTIWSP